MSTKLFSPAAPWALFPLRVVIGIVFLTYGGQKLFVFGFKGFSAYLAGHGIPGAGFWGVVVPLVEFLGGLAVLLGFFTRYAAAVLAIDMIVAIFTVHISNGFFLPKGYAFALTVLGGCITLFLGGSGRASLNAVFRVEESS